MIRVALNGYGRIGRIVHRQMVEEFSDTVEVVATNAFTDAQTRAYLLRRDSLHGLFRHDVKATGDDSFAVDGKEVQVVRERDPKKCPWKDLEIDVVVEATGQFRTMPLAAGHLDAGAKKVIISAPPKDDMPTFVCGVNDQDLKSEDAIISNASCTTNCIAPVIKVLDDKFGIVHGLVGTVHAYTVSQNMLDNSIPPGKDLRRTRSATMSVIPTTTGAVQACEMLFPHLKGKLNGMALRIPMPTVSAAYMVMEVKKKTSVEDVNARLRESAATDDLNGILAVNDEPLVSIDYQTDPRSSIVDALSTEVVDDTAVQILAWYDNEWGYAMRLSEMVVKIGGMILSP